MTDFEKICDALKTIEVPFSQWEDDDEEEQILGFGMYSWVDNLYSIEVHFSADGKYLTTIYNNCNFHSKNNY